eukprot:TRINITY_DN6995_c0_g1_i1.p2 TRINITY_DN6995_c0_g1~~TRINITY_DN6995_c0_g1_i1.p2  ORF type:complete len:480 (-),score=141.87 TRINITY_DN6995_c0_g1_i1:1848-3287(-)
MALLSRLKSAFNGRGKDLRTSIAHKIVPSSVTTQEHLDTFKSLLLLNYNKHNAHQYDNMNGRQEGYKYEDNLDEEALEKDLALLSFEKQKSSIKDILDRQILEIFKHVHSTKGFNPYPMPVPSKEMIERENQPFETLQVKLLSDLNRSFREDIDDNEYLAYYSRKQSNRNDGSSITTLMDVLSPKSETEESEAEPAGSRSVPSSERITNFRGSGAESSRFAPRTPINEYYIGEPYKHPHGFTLQIKKSSIDHPASGYGVFVKGHVLPGTVLGFYPGTVCYRNRIPTEAGFNNDYLISSYDGLIFDAKNWYFQALQGQENIASLKRKLLIKQNLIAASNESEKKEIDALKEEDIQWQLQGLNRFMNPFGNGSFINHPPPHRKPNVQVIPYDFSATLYSNILQSYIPNELFEKVDIFENKQNVMNSLAVIASRHLYDEELFLNYRLNPEFDYPPWYVQPDLEEAQRRWNTKTSMFLKFLGK